MLPNALLIAAVFIAGTAFGFILSSVGHFLGKSADREALAPAQPALTDPQIPHLLIMKH